VGYRIQNNDSLQIQSNRVCNFLIISPLDRPFSILLSKKNCIYIYTYLYDRDYCGAACACGDGSNYDYKTKTAPQ
jgi:hypothetical protein